MRAILFEAPGAAPRLAEVATPVPGPGQVLIRVGACAVCRTDLHILDGELQPPQWPVIPGHQVAGVVVETGPGVEHPAVGERVGVAWLGWADGVCRDCRAGRENLCARARFTGYDLAGGYAEYTVAHADFCLPLPAGSSDIEAAPLLCGGAIGYRALRLAGEAERLGLYGFGNAARLLTQVARFEGRRVFAFTRPGQADVQREARALGAEWAGGSDGPPPEELDAAILFAAAGELVPVALAAVRRGGSVVCAEIHMSDIPSFPYRILWGERVLRSVANLTRRDGRELLALAPRVPLRVETSVFPLERAGAALDAFRAGTLHGTAVLVPEV